MTLWTVLLASWLLLSLPMAVLMGRCIQRGLTPPLDRPDQPRPVPTGEPARRHVDEGTAGQLGDLPCTAVSDGDVPGFGVPVEAIPAPRLPVHDGVLSQPASYGQFDTLRPDASRDRF